MVDKSSPEDSAGQPATAPEDPSFRLPSANYQEATRSGVYRLSELMFGSLLASYVLGFVGAAIAQPVALTSLPIASLLQAAGQWLGFALSAPTPIIAATDFLFMSLAFSYLTAGLYISYHAGVLTMPHMPLGRLSWDFVVALSQAVCFGFSLLLPPAFPSLFGLAVISALSRQQLESTKLRQYLASQISLPRPAGRGVEELKRERLVKVTAALAANRQALSGWTAPSFRIWFVTTLLLLSGPLLWATSASWPEGAAIGAPIIHILTTVFIVIIGHSMLAKNGPLLIRPENGREDVLNELDRSAKDLQVALLKIEDQQ